MTRKIPAANEVEAAQTEEGLRTIEAILMQTVIAIVLGNFYTQYNYSSLNVERAKIKNQQIQLQSLFMNQPEGVLIYRDLSDTAKDGEVSDSKRKTSYE